MNVSNEDREILLDFVNESNEGIEKTERLLLQCEESLPSGRPVDPKLIDTIFRTIHSIKGSAGFIGLERTNALAHQTESLLDQVRKGRRSLTKPLIDIFLEVCDELQMVLDHLSTAFSEQGYQGNIEDIIQRLEQLSDQDPAGPRKKPAPEPRPPVAEAEQPSLSQENLITPEMREQFITESLDLIEGLEQDLLSLEKTPGDARLVESAFRSLHSLKGNAEFFNYADIASISHKAETFLDLVRSGKRTASARQITLILQVLDFIRTAVENLGKGSLPVIPGKVGLLDLMGELLVGGNSSLQSSAEDEPEKQKAPAVSRNAPSDSDSESEPVVDGSTESTLPRAAETRTNEVIRVDVGKLNRLMDLVGEIVIAGSMVSHNPDIAGLELEDFEKSITYLQKNIRELQNLATSMRMIPLSGLFGKMRRLVRDISAKKKNRVELITSGGETEVDRSVIEHISDPLVHILRNAIDHGIESPEQRRRAGKNPTGTIFLQARRVGGEIWIIVTDDGAGLNRKKILTRAREKGLLADDQEELSDDKICNLIFQPGLSTASSVTSISGRGVGMDVVSKNIEKIRGHIDVSSQQGKGTTIYLKIPLTTAIIDGMLMRIGQTTYAVPILDIKESIQVGENQVVDLIDGQEVVRVRDRLIPLLRLQDIHHNLYTGKVIHENIVMITETAGKAVGFLVDEIMGQQQLVIKPLPAYLGKLKGVSGCAVLGNGDICLILDLATLVKEVQSLEAPTTGAAHEQ